MSLPHPETVKQRTRTVSLAVVLWLFGLSTTVLLIGLWGRSVATDEVTLETSARAVLESELVNDRMDEWIGDAMAVAADRAPDDIAGAVADVTSSRAFRNVLDDLVDQSVAAALAPPGEAVTIDLSGSVEAMVPGVVEALSRSGVEVDRDVIRADVAALADVVLASPRSRDGAGAARSAAQILTWVFVFGLGGLAVNGAAAILLAPDRLRQARSLGVRLAVSAVTFAIILRIGAWAVDPRGGRSSIRTGGSVLLASNGHVPVLVALVAGAMVACATYVLVRRRRRRGVRPDDGSQPGPRNGDRASTASVPVGVG
jgi:hypothetical protein